MNTQNSVEHRTFILYNQDGIVVRNSIANDVNELFWKLRKSDIDELWASHHQLPKDALREGFDCSLICLSILIGEEVVAMFGVLAKTLLGDKASIWLLASPKLENISYRFLKHSRRFINMFLEHYPYLYNYVDDRNKVSIAWLRFCGAEMLRPMPYGAENLPFRYFYFERNSLCVIQP